ncbi:MAG: GTPase ObgE, partial [Spirochaetes bacterium]
KYQNLKKEMESYKSSLLNKKIIVVINKMDLVNRKTLNSFKEEFKDEEIVFISALKKEGVDVLLRKIYKVLKDEEDSN